MEILIGVEENDVIRVLNDPYFTGYGVAQLLIFKGVEEVSDKDAISVSYQGNQEAG